MAIKKPVVRRGTDALPLRFFRVGFTIGGIASASKRWGAVALSYVPISSIRYFNLSVDGTWCLRNVPVFAAQYRLDRYVQTMYFDLGSRAGAEVRYGASLTPGPIEIMPATSAAARLKKITARYGGVRRDQRLVLADAPPPWRGTEMQDAFACRLDYPNQPCGKNECGPTAVSNSLKWLNAKYNLGIPLKKLEIDFWKPILAWTPARGVPNNGVWADDKVNYCNDKNNQLPIDSTKLVGAKIADALKEFERGQAIEFLVGEHIVAVTCMSKGADGNYVVNAVSDAAQNGQDKPGNPVSEMIHVDPNGTTITGPPWAIGKNGCGLAIENFLVQCPAPNKWKAK